MPSCLRSVPKLITATVFLFLSATAGRAQQNLNCSSEDGKRHYCQAETRFGVDLVRQRSGSPCTPDYSWGYDQRGIWVDHGCRADFATRPAPPVINCSSEDGKRHFCSAENRAGVRLVNQRSGSPCTKDYSWGFDDRGIWVDHGCRADFAPEAGPSYDNDDGEDQIVSCASDDGGRHSCEADTRRGVRLSRQISGSSCDQGRSWDYDDRGIWVDRGCRAEFVVRRHRRDQDHGRDDRAESDYDNDGAFADRTISCSSEGGQRHYCQLETRAAVRLVSQRSGSPCTKDYSWGFDERGIWVDHGCRADFALETGPAYDSSGDSQVACYRSVGPERSKRLVDQCLQVSPATHPPCNAENACSLIIDEIRRSCAQLGRDAPSFCDAYR